jgi:hypothetical protein
MVILGGTPSAVVVALYRNGLAFLLTTFVMRVIYPPASHASSVGAQLLRLREAWRGRPALIGPSSMRGLNQGTVAQQVLQL